MAALGQAMDRLGHALAETESPRMTAERVLLRAFGEGDLPASVLNDADGQVVPTPAAQWRVDAARDTFQSGRIEWTTGVVMLGGPWPLKVAGRVLVKEPDVAAWLRGEAVQPSPPSATLPALAQPVKARPPSAAALSEWYLARVAGWPSAKAPPSADTDLSHAREAMPAVSRDAVRAARADHAPDAWTGKGRRKTRAGK